MNWKPYLFVACLGAALAAGGCKSDDGGGNNGPDLPTTREGVITALTRDSSRNWVMTKVAYVDALTGRLTNKAVSACQDDDTVTFYLKNTNLRSTTGKTPCDGQTAQKVQYTNWQLSGDNKTLTAQALGPLPLVLTKINNDVMIMKVTYANDTLNTEFKALK